MTVRHRQASGIRLELIPGVCSQERVVIVQLLNDAQPIVNGSAIKWQASYYMITSEQVRAARALLRWEQKDLAAASTVSLPSIQRLETKPGTLAAQARTIAAIQSALEAAGVEFIPENGGGAGVRLKKGKA